MIPIGIAVAVGWVVYRHMETRRKQEEDFDAWWESNFNDSTRDFLYVDLLEEMWNRPYFIDQDDSELRNWS